MINFIELECPNCGGGMKRVKRDMCKCTYCNALYIIDKEKNQVTPIPPKENGASRSAIIAVIICIVMFLAIFLIVDYLDRQPIEQVSPIVQAEKKISSAYFIEFIDKVFEKTPDTITQEELGCVRTIIFEDHREQDFIQYRLEGEELKRIPIDAEVYNRTDDLCFFVGLEDLEVGSQSLYAEDIGNMRNLQKIACGNRPQSLAESVHNPANIKSLSLDYSDTSLTGIGAFSNLEELIIDNRDLTDITDIVQLSKLKKLSLQADELTDYNMIGELSGLTELFFQDEMAKDVSFIEKLSRLTSLEIYRTKVIDIDFLENNTALKRLIFYYDTEIKDYLVVEKLTNLEELYISSSSDMPMPNLSELTHLTDLTISGSADLTIVSAIPNLNKLSLYSGTFDLKPLSGMDNLHEIYYSSLAGTINHTEVLKSLPNLEVLNISGVNFLQDMTFIFELPNLRELILNDSKVGVNIGQITKNDTLKILNISNTSFITNMQVVTSGIITVADYDTLSFDECKPLISSYVGLEELYVGGQKIEDIEFVSELPSLKILDIADNYVKDLHPLNGLADFSVVFCKDNPIVGMSTADYEIVDKYGSSLYKW